MSKSFRLPSLKRRTESSNDARVSRLELNLHALASAGHVDEFRKKMKRAQKERGASIVNAADRKGRTALHIAAENAHRPLVVFLLQDCRAAPDLLDELGWTPLHCAAHRGHVPVARALLAYGAPADSVSRDGGTALHYLVRHHPSPSRLHDFSSLLRRLVLCGCPVNAAKVNGDTALHYAATAGTKEHVEMLLYLNADPLQPNINEQTPVDVARRAGYDDIVQLLNEAIERRRHAFQGSAIAGEHTAAAGHPFLMLERKRRDDGEAPRHNVPRQHQRRKSPSGLFRSRRKRHKASSAVAATASSMRARDRERSGYERHGGGDALPRDAGPMLPPPTLQHQRQSTPLTAVASAANAEFGRSRAARSPSRTLVASSAEQLSMPTAATPSSAATSSSSSATVAAAIAQQRATGEHFGGAMGQDAALLKPLVPHIDLARRPFAQLVLARTQPLYYSLCLSIHEGKLANGSGIAKASSVDGHLKASDTYATCQVRNLASHMQSTQVRTVVAHHTAHPHWAVMLTLPFLSTLLAAPPTAAAATAATTAAAAATKSTAPATAPAKSAAASSSSGGGVAKVAAASAIGDTVLYVEMWRYEQGRRDTLLGSAHVHFCDLPLDHECVPLLRPASRNQQSVGCHLLLSASRWELRTGAAPPLVVPPHMMPDADAHWKALAPPASSDDRLSHELSPLSYSSQTSNSSSLTSRFRSQVATAASTTSTAATNATSQRKQSGTADDRSSLSPTLAAGGGSSTGEPSLPTTTSTTRNMATTTSSHSAIDGSDGRALGVSVSPEDEEEQHDDDSDDDEQLSSSPPPINDNGDDNDDDDEIPVALLVDDSGSEPAEALGMSRSESASTHALYELTKGSSGGGAGGVRSSSSLHNYMAAATASMLSSAASSSSSSKAPKRGVSVRRVASAGIAEGNLYARSGDDDNAVDNGQDGSIDNALDDLLLMPSHGRRIGDALLSNASASDVGMFSNGSRPVRVESLRDSRSINVDCFSLTGEEAVDQFKILSKLGEGGSSIVYKARHRLTGTIVAIKDFNISPASEAAAEVHKEIAMLKRVASPCIVGYLGSVNISANHVWVVLEYCSGGSVKEMLTLLDITLSEVAIAYVAASVLVAMTFLHACGIVHRDLKVCFFPQWQRQSVANTNFVLTRSTTAWQHFDDRTR
jgi:ankyrin repeat protein